VTSERLRQRASQFSSRVHLFPFGVSFDKFERARLASDGIPADLAALPRPIAGYVGGIHQWIDFPLLASVARQLPEVSFALVGPVQCDVSALKLPNIHLLGKRPHDELPRYLKAFDAGLVPYRLTDYTANVYPTKLNEYLAMGMPVVATDLPEIRRFNREHGPTVAVVSDAAAFAAALRSALASSTEQERSQRVAVARNISWAVRIERMSALVDEALETKRSQREAWDVALRRIYRRARERSAATIAGVALVYLLVFQTSLPWLIASPLRVSSPPVPADAIVVLAGGVGESGAAGGGYQERVKRAVELYQQRLAPVMIFQSGYTFAFREAEIMRALAVAQGVPDEAIVLETSGRNTYEAIVRVQAVLDEHRWRRVLLVSSPYHMRRALLTWHRQQPSTEVIASPVADSQFYAHGRGASVQQIGGLAFEYAAIAWYWCTDRI
jgi:uncharacterized SAM-binding protein YcdF (DUF218 family)